MSTPVQPHWTRPSHPDIQDVVAGNDTDFTSKSFSKVSLPPFAVFAKMAFPPCTIAEDGATYATVQIGKNRHLNLNSDLLYINHSCEPSLIFDTANYNVLAGPKGLQPGDELTFFYPSTEWDMAQPFACLCGKETCRGTINGAKHMSRSQLAGVWLNGHIRELLEERERTAGKPTRANGNDVSGNGHHLPAHGAEEAAKESVEDATTLALRDALRHAEKVVEAARAALHSYMESSSHNHGTTTNETVLSVRNGTKSNGSNGHGGANKNRHHHGEGNDTVASGGDVQSSQLFAAVTGSERRGPTSRELAGEMGGDTTSA